MKRICVAGHANNSSVNEKNVKWAKIIADWIVDNNYELLTGGCIGLPELASDAVAEKHGSVVAYSPATNANEHVTEFGFANNPNVRMKYLQPSKATKNAKFLYRSIDLIEDSDLVICFKGTWGTLSEIVFAVMCSKKILFLNIDGDNDTLRKVYDLMTTINLYNWHEQFIEVKSEKELKAQLKKYAEENK